MDFDRRETVLVNTEIGNMNSEDDQSLQELFCQLGKAYFEGAYEDPLPQLLPLFVPAAERNWKRGFVSAMHAERPSCSRKKNHRYHWSQYRKFVQTVAIFFDRRQSFVEPVVCRRVKYRKRD